MKYTITEPHELLSILRGTIRECKILDTHAMLTFIDNKDGEKTFMMVGPDEDYVHLISDEEFFNPSKVASTKSIESVYAAFGGVSYHSDTLYVTFLP